MGFMKAHTRVFLSYSIALALFPLIVFTEKKFYFDVINKMWDSGDSLYVYALNAKRTVYRNDPSHFGFPRGMNLDGFPVLDLFNQFLQLIFSLFVESPFTAVNLSILALVFLNFTFAHLLSIHFVEAPWLRYIFSLNILLLPWVFHRLEHPTLLFFMVALTPLLLLKERRKAPSILTLAFLGVLVGLQSPYLVFFTFLIFFLILVTQRFKQPVEYLSFGLCTVFAFLLNLYLTSGGNFQVADSFKRRPLESFVFGGESLNWLLPAPNFFGLHFPEYRSWVYLLSPLRMETEALSLSNFGNASVLFALFVIVSLIITQLANRLPVGSFEKKIILILSVLYLFYIKGGLGFVFSLTINAQIRSWNRLAPVMQALLLMLCVYLVDRKFANTIKSRTFTFYATSTLVLILSIGNLIGSGILDKSEDLGKYIAATNQIGKLLPQKCGILQLPHQSFPEGKPIYNLEPYDHFAISILDSNHSYSFGAVRDSMNDKFIQNAVTAIELGSTVNSYCGILLDKRGDPQSIIEKKLDKYFNKKYFISPNYLLYNINKGNFQRNQLRTP
jgi:hypothetical protein